MQYQNYLFTLSRLAFFVLLLTFCAVAVTAQDIDDVIRTQTSLIQLNVGVVDRQGRPVTSLTRNDFVIYEDGVKQSIQHFEPAEAPFSLVLLLDMSGSTINFRQQLKLASQRFLDALAPDDRVAVIQFNAKVKSLTSFSTDRLKTAYALEIAAGAGETYFYEALRYSLKELETEGQRRKAIVVLTDGLGSNLRKGDRASVAAEWMRVSDERLGQGFDNEDLEPLVGRVVAEHQLPPLLDAGVALHRHPHRDLFVARPVVLESPRGAVRVDDERLAAVVRVR